MILSFLTKMAKLIAVNLQVNGLAARIYGKWQDVIQTTRLIQVL